jgi:hypothetical protein
MGRLKISLLVFLQSSDGFSHRFGQSLIKIQFQHVLNHQHQIVSARVTGIRQDFNKSTVGHSRFGIRQRPRKVVAECHKKKVAIFGCHVQEKSNNFSQRLLHREKEPHGICCGIGRFSNTLNLWAKRVLAF